jgi:uracil-DNA glycosylase family 4
VEAGEEVAVVEAAVAATEALSLAAYRDEVAGCTKCALAKGRTQVVFGSGSPTAELMFVGEAPGFHEDKQGVPFVGAAGQLLGKLLAGIGMTRDEVFVANVLKCLRYNAMVQLGDGSWERIGRLVRTKYAGTVMAVDAAGHLVPRRVTGWHETPLGNRRVYKLSYMSSKRAGASRVGIELTGDHPVLTQRGYVAIQDLRLGERIATGQGLSDVAFDVVCGTLLGDGSIRKASSLLQFGHGANQAEFAAFKAEALAEFDPVIQQLLVAATSGGAATYTVTHVRTRAARVLRTIRKDFYRERKVVPPWIADELNDRMLAIWYLDDGYTRIRHNRRPAAEIATNAFSEADRRVLLRGLGRLGLPARALRSRIFFDTDTTQTLLERIAPYTPPSMRYKLGPDVALRIPFDPDRFEKGPRRIVFDPALVEDITDQPRADTTFFCIDVEETHNFVTAGGVVHNCRPPGNRDPQPEEIEACEPHLWRQIELIQPKVIATLGNFATKLLSGKPLGITRVHGVEQEVVLGGNRVMLYPLFHPAAALYTPRMLEVLEADFRRLPDLLGEATAPPAPLVEVVPPPASEPEAVQLGLF